MSDEHLIARLAEEAVNETQLMMIMDYRSFESQLYHTVAQKIINECNLAVRINYNQHYEYYKEYKHTPEDVEQAINKHFGIEDGDNK